LAVLAASNDRVQEALAPSTFPGLGMTMASRDDRLERRQDSAVGVAAGAPAALVQQLDDLAQDIVSTPGAGGALLAAYAAQARALSMVVEAARRAGASPLPTAVLLAAQEALSAPSPLPGFALG
jgi:adenine/guanine phosphoribosyltransferase-like PRPP-binding protein